MDIDDGAVSSKCYHQMLCHQDVVSLGPIQSQGGNVGINDIHTILHENCSAVFCYKIDPPSIVAAVTGLSKIGKLTIKQEEARDTTVYWQTVAQQPRVIE